MVTGVVCHSPMHSIHQLLRKLEILPHKHQLIRELCHMLVNYMQNVSDSILLFPALKNLSVSAPFIAVRGIMMCQDLQAEHMNMRVID
jgi:hypothetical protein